MDLARLLKVLEICLPVFALIGLGRLLFRRGWMNDEQLAILEKLVYYISLPCLLFLGVAGQPFRQLIDPAILSGTLGGCALVLIVFCTLAVVLRVPRHLRAPFVFGTMWANTAYLGFPLAVSAFGPVKGLAFAGIVNAFTMPVFNFIAYVLIHFWGRGEGEKRGFLQLLRMMANPIILSTLAGVLFALGVDLLGLRRLMADHLVIQAGVGVCARFLKLLGEMGLPLALISVGASLRAQAVRHHLGLMSLTLLGKLLILPLLTFGLMRWLYPGWDASACGVAVLLMAMPGSVASYVIGKRMGVAPEFIATLLVVGTALSILTTPLWLYFLI